MAEQEHAEFYAQMMARQGLRSAIEPEAVFSYHEIHCITGVKNTVAHCSMFRLFVVDIVLL